jgi:hypothetical protein
MTDKPTIHDPEWTDYVLSQLNDDEKIMGNPTTDGLRRIFENVMNCEIMESSTKVDQAPSPENEKRATVTFSLSFKPNEQTESRLGLYNTKLVTGAADVYWGNCDKIFRNHPVAVAETRAEGRALRRALRLKKVVAAEELAAEIEDHPDHDSVSKITVNQINFIDVLAKRLDINPTKCFENMGLANNLYELDHANGVSIIRQLSSYQQDTSAIPETIKGYEEDWK